METIKEVDEDSSVWGDEKIDFAISWREKPLLKICLKIILLNFIKIVNFPIIRDCDEVQNFLGFRTKFASAHLVRWDVRMIQIWNWPVCLDELIYPINSVEASYLLRKKLLHKQE